MSSCALYAYALVSGTYIPFSGMKKTLFRDFSPSLEETESENVTCSGVSKFLGS